MSIVPVTDTETRLTNTLRVTTEALQAMTAERDDLSKLLHQALDERDHYIKARDALEAAAQVGMDALLKKNGAWGQGHDELEARAISQLQAAMKWKS